MKEIKVKSITELEKASKKFLEHYRKETVFAFYGGMGAGKTTFIKSICEQLKVIDTVNSPTFSLINEYFTQEGKTVFHFDFYRIDEIQEALNIGCEDYFYSGNICLIEWPEKIEGILPDGTVKVYIDVLPDQSRKIIFG